MPNIPQNLTRLLLKSLLCQFKVNSMPIEGTRRATKTDEFGKTSKWEFGTFPKIHSIRFGSATLPLRQFYVKMPIRNLYFF